MKTPTAGTYCKKQGNCWIFVEGGGSHFGIFTNDGTILKNKMLADPSNPYGYGTKEEAQAFLDKIAKREGWEVVNPEDPKWRL